MGRKLLVGILWVTLSLFVLGCSASGEKNAINIPREKSREEEKRKACIDELPELEKISKDYKSKGLKVVGVVSGGNFEKIEANKILKNKNINFDNIIPSEKFIDDFVSRENAIPYTVIVNKKGEIKKFLLGSRSYEDFQKILNEEIKIAK